MLKFLPEIISVINIIIQFGILNLPRKPFPSMGKIVAYENKLLKKIPKLDNLKSFGKTAIFVLRY
jgi:hypothetical protein